MFKKITLSLMALALIITAIALYPVVPNTKATHAKDFSLFDSETTTQINEIIRTDDSVDALVIASSDRILFSSGKAHLPTNTHSIRKSIMHVLLGMAELQGKLDISKTLDDLDIDDSKSPLSTAEKKATVDNLMKSRSGIYISSAGEHDEQITDRPSREQYQPGQFYFSNNWDSNALDTVLSKTGKNTKQYLIELAEILKLEDFDPKHFYYQKGKYSEHKQYTIFMSARDLIKIGQMMLRQGQSNQGKKVVNSQWVQNGTQTHSKIKHPIYEGYGAMWWIDETSSTYWTDGWGGQLMLIDPQNDIVIVSRNFTGRRIGEVLWLSVLGKAKRDNPFNMLKIRELILSDNKL